MKRSVSIFALIVAAGIARAASNDLETGKLAGMSLQELMQIEIPTVVGASKHEQKITEAPSAVTIVTADDIRKFGYRTLGDILRSVPGFYISYDRSYGFIGVRGFSRPGDYGGRILLLVNGHRLNDPVYDSSASATDFLLDVDLIERVEVMRGSGSSFLLYGNNAFFAVINVITRRGRQMDGAEVSASAGSLDTYRARTTYGKLFGNGVEVLVSGSIQDSRGNQRLYVPEFGATAVGLDDDQFHSVFASVGFQGLTLEGGYLQRDKQVPNALYDEVFGDPRYQLRDERAYADLRFERTLSDGTDLLARGYYDLYRYRGDYPDNHAAPGDPPDVGLNRDNDSSHSAGFELRGQRTVFERHTVTAGFEFHSDFVLQLKNADLNPAFTYQHTQSDSYWLAVYAQDEWRILDNLILNGGVRCDYFQAFGATVNPRLALIWDPVKGTTLKAIGGTAFRAPNAYERLYVTDVNTTDPNLGPEKITSGELIWQQAVDKNLLATVSGFYNDVQDLIGQTTDGSGNTIYQNLSSAKSYGAEFTLDGQWANGWRGRVSYTLAETEDDNGLRLDNSPLHLAKLNVVAPLYRDKVSAGLEVQYTSDRTAPSGDKINDFVTVNLTLFAHRFWGGWEASASLYNAFDTKYNDPTDTVPALVQQDGRQWRVKLTYRF